jgi:hypothetical protein
LDRPEVHDLTCTDATHRIIFIPFLCKGHWILACVSPVNPGHIAILSSRMSDGIPEVKKALRSYLASRDRDAPARRGIPIVSWRCNVRHSPREHPRSNDGGVFLLLHIASVLFGRALPDCLTDSVRVALAGLLSSCRGGWTPNFFRALGPPAPTSVAAPRRGFDSLPGRNAPISATWG